MGRERLLGTQDSIHSATAAEARAFARGWQEVGLHAASAAIQGLKHELQIGHHRLLMPGGCSGRQTC